MRVTIAQLSGLVREKYPRAYCVKGAAAHRVKTGIGRQGKVLGIGATAERAWRNALLLILSKE
jgi:hypothetical protein